MKALTMLQPYAWLFANKILTIDDRSWCTRYRGPVAIHAARRFHAPLYDWLSEHTNIALPNAADFDFGGIVGVANLVDCLAPPKPGDTSQESLRHLRSHSGIASYYGLVFQDARPLAFIPWLGIPGLFEYSGPVELPVEKSLDKLPE